MTCLSGMAFGGKLCVRNCSCCCLQAIDGNKNGLPEQIVLCSYAAHILRAHCSGDKQSTNMFTYQSLLSYFIYAYISHRQAQK